MDFKSIFDWYSNTRWHQWWVNTVWKPSWTKLTTSVYGIPAGLLVVAEQASKWANDTTIQGYMAQLSIPNWVPMGLAGLALFHYVVMGHDD